jgi:hypothetical protein
MRSAPANRVVSREKEWLRLEEVALAAAEAER